MIIDRFEGEFAVIEYEGKLYNLPKVLLPQDSKEGDVIEININKDETQKRKKNIKNLMDKLWDK
jgi:hypothetical protein